MDKKDVLIIGNDARIYDISEEIASVNNRINLTVIIDGEHIYEIEKSFKPTNYPTIYGKVKEINPYKKEVLLSNGGIITYEFLVLTPEISIPFQVNENISGIYPLYEREVIDNIREIITSHKFILIVGLEDKELSVRLSKYGKTFELIKPEDLKEVKSFDGKITSVVLSDNRLLFADAILVNYYLRKKPSYLFDTGLSLNKLELFNIYYLDIYEDSSTLLNLISKLEPPLLYTCPAKLKVIPECNFIMNEVSACGYYNPQICTIQNTKGIRANTIITRFIEGNITGFMNEEGCNLCEFGICKNDFHLCGFSKNEALIHEFLEKTLKTLISRSNLLPESFRLELPISKIGDAFKCYKIEELKNFAKLMIKQNREILKNLSLRSGEFNSTNIDFNFGAFNKDKINILYISNREFIDSKFFKYMEEKATFNFICMGCGGIETSVKFGGKFPFLGSVLDEEFSVLTGLLDGVIIDEGCILAGFLKRVYELGIPILLKCKKTKDVFSFVSSLSLRKRETHILNLSKSKTFVGLPDKNLKDLNVNGFVLVPGCSGSCIGEKFISGIKEFILKDYAVFASGCSLANLSNLGYLGAAYDFSSSLKVFGAGSFFRIYEIGNLLKDTNLPVYIYLQGIIKHDAILDAFTLKDFFGFKIITDDKKTNNYIRAIYE